MLRQMDPPERLPSLESPLPNEVCTVCANLRRLLFDNDIVIRQAQGPLESLLETTCLGHGSLFNTIRNDVVQGGLDKQISEYCKTYYTDTTSNAGAVATQSKIGDNSAMIENSSESDEAIKGKMNGQVQEPGSLSCSLWLGWYTDGGDPLKTPHIWVMLDDCRTISMEWEPLIARRCDEPQTPGFGRTLDPEWADLDLARRWKRDCLSLHKDKCRNPLNISPVSPAWVIDTTLQCIVPGSNIPDYVALSYRWGASAGFRMTSDLLEDLQEKGELLQGSRLGDSMAPILRHAIELTRAIDERYLWVDAVCIVQDDEEHLATQLGLMGAIYATAKLTIVASDGDAVDGLLGLKGISPPRWFNQKLTTVFESEQVIFRQSPEFQTGYSPYFNRGWTFQEFFLSQRRLIFADGQIHWHCSCADWDEDFIPADSTGEAAFMDGHISDLLKGVPDFESLNMILSEYNARHLSFPEDALPGIIGLLSLLSRTFEGGFLFGLPEAVFDSALMWRPYFRSSMEKREDSGRTELLFQASRLPSWSWVSWKTDELCVLDEETFEVTQFTESRTIPITQWFTHETPMAPQKRPIQSHWFGLRERLNGSNFELPQGWTKERSAEILGPEDERFYHKPPQGLGQYIYRHHALADRKFWLPVPITTGGHERHSPGLSSQTPYISCNTKRGHFAVVQLPITHFAEVDRRSGYYRHFAGLLNESGELCGRLHLQQQDDILRFQEANPGRNCEVEIVAICRRREMTSYSNSWRPQGEDNEDIRNQVSKDLYGVLWVEWIDGIAYRRACGIVDKDEWEAHDLEDIHLIMG